MTISARIARISASADSRAEACAGEDGDDGNDGAVADDDELVEGDGGGADFDLERDDNDDDDDPDDDDGGIKTGDVGVEGAAGLGFFIGVLGLTALSLGSASDASSFTERRRFAV